MGRHSQHGEHPTDRTIALTTLGRTFGMFMLTVGLLVVAVMALPASNGPMVAKTSPSSSPSWAVAAGPWRLGTRRGPSVSASMINLVQLCHSVIGASCQASELAFYSFAPALATRSERRAIRQEKVSIPNIMLISTEWLALVTATIGVGGTLAGAAITQAFATKRENRQWGQNRENQAQLWEREDSLRFHNDKRIAYSAFIGKMHLWSAQMHSQLHGDYGSQAYPPDGFNEFQSEIMSLMAQLELIAPPKVWTAGEVLWGAGAAIALTLALPDMYSKEKRAKNVSDFTGHLQRCISAMRDDLAMDRSRLTGSQQASHRERATSVPERTGNDGRQQLSARAGHKNVSKQFPYYLLSATHGIGRVGGTYSIVN